MVMHQLPIYSIGRLGELSSFGMPILGSKKTLLLAVQINNKLRQHVLTVKLVYRILTRNGIVT